MGLDEVFEKLNVEALTEDAKDSIAKYIDEMVDVKAKDRAKDLVEAQLEEEKTKLAEEYEGKFEDFKEDLSSKWSDFVDEVITEEVKIPETVVEYAKLGEQYKPLLEAIRTSLAVSEGSVDEEAKSLLREAKDEIVSLRKKLDKLIADNMSLKEDATAMATHIYLRKKCDGLTEAQRESVMALLEDATSVKQINDKFDIVLEHVLEEKKHKKVKKEEDEEDEDKDKKKEKKEKKEVESKGKDKEKCDESIELSAWDKLMESYKSSMKVLP